LEGTVLSAKRWAFVFGIFCKWHRFVDFFELFSLAILGFGRVKLYEARVAVRQLLDIPVNSLTRERLIFDEV
jgi:hypothetical protein